MVNLFPGVPAECLCDKHLNSVLAEYNNLLMPSMRKGNSIRKYLDHGCIDLKYLGIRIINCMAESKRRGKNWKYPAINTNDCIIHVIYFDRYIEEIGDFDSVVYYFGDERRKEMEDMNKRILSFRCPECRERIRTHKI
jgi:hypothetical protein